MFPNYLYKYGTCNYFIFFIMAELMSFGWQEEHACNQNASLQILTTQGRYIIIQLQLSITKNMLTLNAPRGLHKEDRNNKTIGPTIVGWH
jgi:hypothetical protein